MPQTASDILERQFLEMRCGILTLAAALDRLDRAEGAEVIKEDERRQRLQEGIEILLSDGDDRAERLQLLFSDPYQEGWNQ